MKKIYTFFFTIVLLCSCSSNVIFDKNAGSIRMAIDNSGKITILEDTSTNVNYICQTPSYLIECRKYNNDSIMIQPNSALLNEKGDIILSYPNGVNITVNITAKEGYFRMEIVDANPLSDIDRITWGPYKTNMQGQAGLWLGIARSDDFTIGLMSIEPNTDTPYHMAEAASYISEGTSLQLTSYDHTRGVFRVTGNDKSEMEVNKLRSAKPIDVTVKNSAVALYASKSGKENELDIIEKIELAENLPHPIFDGKWNKRSTEGQKFCLWASYNEDNFDKHLAIAKEMGARILCSGDFLSNWGHFEVNTKRYPGGAESLRNDSRKAREQGVGTTLYTLTSFLKPIYIPEPYVSPIPDDRLQTWKAKATLTKAVTAKDTTLRLKNCPDVLATLEAAGTKVLRIDNEMIEFGGFKVDGDEIITDKCTRGVFLSTADEHKENSPAIMMYVAGYHNFFPGTIDLSNELSDNIAKTLIETDEDNFVVDGFESCLEAGYGSYTGNLYMRNIYDKCVENNKETLVTGSNFTQYSWHVNSHESWGEGDMSHGTRGTMLDYRLDRQMKLCSNLMPNKLGQYYPELSTVEDVEWIMAFATGWDSGVDFSINIETFKNKNPHHKEIIATLNKWAQARAENIFTEQQKMELRQTDRQYKLTKNSDGKWELKFDKYWITENVKVLPSSTMDAKAINGGELSSCSIDWSWTHNPAPYDEIILSDDMIHTSGATPSNWSVYYPEYTDPKGSWYPYQKRHYQFVLRLPKDAPCSISDISIDVNGQKFDMPVTLNPGEYISIPHLTPMICIYDENHQVIGEKKLRGYIPSVEKGSTVNVSLSFTPEKKDANPRLIMNARCQNGYFFQ